MVIYVVKQGDTVYNIARRYNVSAQRIISDNALTNPGNLVVGQALIILIPKTVYTVQQGDTLDSIAQKYGTTAIVLLQNNPYLVNTMLRTGQIIVIEFEGAKRRTISINAYAYPYINHGTLRKALPYLTYLTIFGYGFTTSGELIGINDQPLINLAYQFKTAPVMLISSITEDGNFSSAKASLLFNDIEMQNKVLDNIVAVMLEKGYVGLDVDFEFIEAKDREPYIAFLTNTVARMHEHGFFVNTDLAPKTSAEQPGLLYEGVDYAAIGEISDTVLLMTYEWGYTYGPPMAVAPINKVREVVEFAVTQIPREKIFMGIPNYGYDWTLPFEKGVTRAQSIGNEQAIDIAMRHRSVIEFDEIAMSPYFEYFSSDGKKHIVWFEDVRSIEAKFNLADEFGLPGVGYWNAMRPFTQNWALAGALYSIRRVV